LKLFVHSQGFGFCNCYILGTENLSASKSGEAKEAIIIDPGFIDESMIKRIEENEYVLTGVLFTHGHTNHISGITTLKRIYDTEIYCISSAIREYKAIPVRDSEIVNIGSFKIEVIAVPGHSADSAVFKIEQLLFTGDVLSAGLVGSTASVYGAANQMTALRNKILSLPGDYTILPGHGPPSSLEAERRFNTGINSYKDYRSRRRSFRFQTDQNC
jgi:glyoxylase-like metal-dependent hydrolase (beta-lactamase superfamily II)